MTTSNLNEVKQVQFGCLETNNPGSATYCSLVKEINLKLIRNEVESDFKKCFDDHQYREKITLKKAPITKHHT